MRFLAAIGCGLLLVAVAAVAYAGFGFYDVSATDPHPDAVRWVVGRAMESAVRRGAGQEVNRVPPLDAAEAIRTGGEHYRHEGCLQCHGGPGLERAEFAEHMRPRPPDLTRAASRWSDAELYWIMKHGIKMTGMPAFGPTHDEAGLWAMVAFVRRLPGMSPSEFGELTQLGPEHESGDAQIGEDEHHAPGPQHGHKAED